MGKWLHVFCFKVVLLGLLASVSAEAVEPLRLYGSDAIYSVERKGKTIGEYRLAFRAQPDDRLVVNVSMQLQLRYLGLFKYDFSYRAEEVWQAADRLVAMDVIIDDDGDTRRYRLERRSDGLYRLNGDTDAVRLGDSLLTSNHWHSGLVEQSRLINTLTGEVSRLNVVLQGEEHIQIGARQVRARRYHLGGELEDTLSWYDEQGRWLGMEFSARDGSRIRLRLQPGAELAEREAP